MLRVDAGDDWVRHEELRKIETSWSAVCDASASARSCHPEMPADRLRVFTGRSVAAAADASSLLGSVFSDRASRASVARALRLPDRHCGIGAPARTGSGPPDSAAGAAAAGSRSPALAVARARPA